jgi:hypothetical protein
VHSDIRNTLAPEAALERAKAHVRLLLLPRNLGKSAALIQAWIELETDLRAGLLTPDSIVITVDADGQHDLAQLGAPQRCGRRREIRSRAAAGIQVARLFVSAAI